MYGMPFVAQDTCHAERISARHETLEKGIEMTRGISRRNFLTASFIAGAGAAAAGLAGCAPKTAAQSAQLSSTGAEALATDGTPSFMIPPEPIADDQISETIEADVVVVGCGAAALETALSALREGLTVAMFARAEHPVARGGSNCGVYSKEMEKMGLPRMDGDKFLRSQLAQASYNVNTAMWYRFYNNSEESMNWMIDEMANVDGMYVTFEPVGIYPTDTTDPVYAPNVTHSFNNADYPIPGNGQQALVEALAQLVEEVGGTIAYGVEAEQLIRGDVTSGTEGRVTGCVGRRKSDDAYIKFVGNKAVVLATGDFSGNREMMETYAPHAVKYISNWDYELTDPDEGICFGGLYEGRGHKMGLWCGAAWQRTFPNAIMAVEEFGTTASGMTYSCHNGLMVDIDGQRFCNEVIPYSYFVNVLDHLKGGHAYAIMDCKFPETRIDWMNRGKPLGDPEESLTPEQVIASWDEKVETGAMWKADTLEELLTQMELPVEATMATIEKYNGWVEVGEDQEFHKDPALLAAIATPPFYGWKSNEPRFLTVLGGLRTNANMQVCDEDDNPIPGLYNVGTMVGDFFSNYYTFLVAGHNYGGACLTFGYLTGKFIAENE